MTQSMSKSHKSCHTLMIQGTTSDAGKTTLVAGLCRVLARKNKQVAPFKPQNMALNSAVTPCGGEIGRAQAVQAHAAFIEPEIDFNPILLKPNSDTGAQVIVHGKAISDMEATSYHDYKKVAMEAVLSSHQRLKNKFNYIMVEGAGSPAEINLREGDIANMGFAEAVNCPVILVADIDRGGVFAHLVGTLALLSQSEQNRVVGFIINRFRGDITLLQSGLDWLEQRTNKPVLGVMPYLHGLTIAAEDAVDNSQHIKTAKLVVIVLVYPRMSNHNDFDPLRVHPEIDCRFIYPTNDNSTKLPPADLIILPGSKNVREDLASLKAQNWHHDIAKHLRYGGKIWGICGGYQMLGNNIIDPTGIEGSAGSSKGLGYFPTETTLHDKKTLKNVSGNITLNNVSAPITGYEIHAGNTHKLNNDTQNILAINSEDTGMVSDDKQIAGCYTHGLFDTPEALQLIISWCGAEVSKPIDFQQQQSASLDILADACETHLNIEEIERQLLAWEL